MARRSTVLPAEPPELLAARQWVLSSGFADIIEVTNKGKLRVYGVEFDPSTFLGMSDDDALDALMAASVRAELGDDPGDLEL